MSLANTPMTLQVTRIVAQAKDVLSLELSDPCGDELPPFTPGAHLELQLRNGLIRHYSLLNDSSERHRYVVAVGLSADSRGGSRYIHGSLRQGDSLRVVGPRNNFPLDESAERFCFVAGGIGITPILSMIRWCVRHGKDWRLVYAARNRSRAAFYEELQALDAERVHYHFSDERNGEHLAVEELIASLREGEQLYCCGPDALMQAVKQVSGVVTERVHFEWFAAPEQPADESASSTGFDLVLRRSERTLRVAEGQSILEVLEAAGLDVPFSCRSGICRSCETGICAGTADHRDLVLSEEERASNTSMLICVSRALSSSLELDL